MDLKLTYDVLIMLSLDEFVNRQIPSIDMLIIIITMDFYIFFLKPP